MEKLLLSLDVNLHVDDCQITKEKIIFDVSSISTSANCPTCRCESISIHDTYTTHIQDLPIQNNTVYLNLLIRRFKCQNPTCSKKTFSESFPFRERNARKTTRLMGLIVDLLESREKEDVIEWLKNFKCVELVSRDRSRTYSAAIKKAFPRAIQVTDRFHLVARLCELVQTLMRYSFPQGFQSRFPMKSMKNLKIFFYMLHEEIKLFMSNNCIPTV